MDTPRPSPRTNRTRRPPAPPGAAWHAEASRPAPCHPGDSQAFSCAGSTAPVRRRRPRGTAPSSLVRPPPRPADPQSDYLKPLAVERPRTSLPTQELNNMNRCDFAYLSRSRRARLLLRHQLPARVAHPACTRAKRLVQVRRGRGNARGRRRGRCAGRAPRRAAARAASDADHEPGALRAPPLQGGKCTPLAGRQMHPPCRAANAPRVQTSNTPALQRSAALVR